MVGSILMDCHGAGSGAIISGVTLGLLARVVRRCVLSLVLRMRRFVGFVDVITNEEDVSSVAVLVSSSVLLRALSVGAT